MDPLNDAKRNGTIVDFLILTLAWLVSLVIVNPVGDFPLNDDWSFGLAVQYFIQQGSFHPTGWTAMSLITNVIWGSIFCLPEGFSFTALRLSTLTASWLGILGAYWLMKELRPSRLLALLVAFTLAFNPIYFELSNTFMTDVPFLTLMIFSAIFFLKNLKTDSTSSLVVATFFSLGSILSRQVALAVPLAFALVAIGHRGFKTQVLLRSLLPLASGILVLAAFQHWLAASGKLPAAYASPNSQMFATLRHLLAVFPSLAHLIYVCLVSAGLFLAPVLVFTGPNNGDSDGKGWLRTGLVFTVLVGFTAFYGYLGMGFTMPLSTDNLSTFGLGPLTLRDAVYREMNPVPMLPQGFWLVVTLISLIGSALLICRMYAVVRRVFAEGIFPSKWGFETQAGVFCFLVSVIYIAPFILSAFFDRYLIPTLPFLAGGFAVIQMQDNFLPRKLRDVVIAFLAISLCIFSVCGTRDYLTWNRTRWQALDNLMTNDQVKPDNIDGGFEFNGFYLYRPAYQIVPGKSFWWVHDDTYLVTFNPVPGYSVFRDYHYTHWMPPYTGNIYVLRKNPGNSSGK